VKLRRWQVSNNDAEVVWSYEVRWSMTKLYIWSYIQLSCVILHNLTSAQAMCKKSPVTHHHRPSAKKQLDPIQPQMCHLVTGVQWIGWREHLPETLDFPLNIELLIFKYIIFIYIYIWPMNVYDAHRERSRHMHRPLRICLRHGWRQDQRSPWEASVHIPGCRTAEVPSPWMIWRCIWLCIYIYTIYCT